MPPVLGTGDYWPIDRRHLNKLADADTELASCGIPGQNESGQDHAHCPCPINKPGPACYVLALKVQKLKS